MCFAPARWHRDGVGTRTFSYSSNYLWQSSEALPSNLASKTLDRHYDNNTGTRRRPIDIAIGTGGGTEYIAAHGYDMYGRLNSVTGPGVPGSGSTGYSPASGSGAAYTFASNSDFAGMVDFNTNGASNVASTIRTYECRRVGRISTHHACTTRIAYDVQ